MSHLFGRTGDNCSYDGDVLENHIAPCRVSAPPSIMSCSSIQQLLRAHVTELITVYNLCIATLTDLPAAISGQDEYLYANLGSQIYEGYQSPLKRLRRRASISYHQKIPLFKDEKMRTTS